MLDRLTDPWALVAAQVAVAVAVVLGVVLLARRLGIGLVSEVSWSMVRGFVQVVAVGSVLAWLLDGPLWTAPLVLLGMLTAAAWIARGQAARVPGAFAIVFVALLVGAGSVIAVMGAVGVLPRDIATLIPVGSMVLSNAMTACVQLLERIRSDLAANRGPIEAGLALGATPERVVAPFVEAAVRASMIPQVNTMMALGIVFIPGLMSGMVLAGADPVRAAVYQFVVIALILAAAGLSSMVAAALVRRRFFTPAAQFVG